LWFLARHGRGVIIEIVFALIACLALPVDGLATAPPAGILDPVAARGDHMIPAEARALSKKEDWLREKAVRPDFRTSEGELSRAAIANKKADKAAKARANKPVNMEIAATPEPPVRPGQRIEPVTTLFNVWTHEALPILPGQTQQLQGRFHNFLRDHYTNQATRMDTRLIGVLTRVAGKFSARRIDVVSGYRSPKYNLMLRKKGRQVARDSQHTHGNAVDFRIKGVTTKQVLHYVRSLRVGGVGFYPHSQFVHSDTGRVRYWTGS
jgi:uncharacterized protein YcbK (DUF882 family)